MRKFKPTDKIFILGRSGCGKSYLGKTIQDYFERKIVIDSLYEYSGGEFDFVVDSYYTLLNSLVHLETKKKWSVLFRFNLGLDEESQLETFDQICNAVYVLGRVCLVIEEVHLYSSPHKIPTWLKNIALMGRHKEVSLICTSQRAGETNKTLLSMSNYIYCGQMIDFNDQKYIGNFIGKRTEELSTIPDRSFIEYSSDSPSTPKIVKNDFLKKGLDSDQKSTVNINSQTKKTNKQEKKS